MAASLASSSYRCSVTMAALAAGTWICHSFPELLSCSRRAGFQIPFAETVEPPSVTPALLSREGAKSRQTDADANEMRAPGFTEMLASDPFSLLMTVSTTRASLDQTA